MTVEDLPGVQSRVLPPWDERSPIPAAMFNPALISASVATAANQYEEISGFPMPWMLAYLVCPLVLHTPTREALPKSVSTNLSKWAGDNPVVVAGFPKLAEQLSPYVREGIRWGLREGTIEVSSSGTFSSELQSLIVPKNAPGDLPVIYRSSGLVGRVFGRTGSAATIFEALRVRP